MRSLRRRTTLELAVFRRRAPSNALDRPFSRLRAYKLSPNDGSVGDHTVYFTEQRYIDNGTMGMSFIRSGEGADIYQTLE